MNNQEAFEKWWDSPNYEVNNDYEEDSPIYWAHIGWQAAQADQADQAATIAQLQADNAKLRDALQYIYDENESYITLNNLGAMDNKYMVVARKALGETK